MNREMSKKQSVSSSSDDIDQFLIKVESNQNTKQGDKSSDAKESSKMDGKL